MKLLGELFGDAVPAPIRDAANACGRHFTKAAVLSALINILALAPTIYMLQAYDRVLPTGGTGTLLALTIAVGWALATMAMLDAMRARIMVRSSLRLERLLAPTILDRLLARRRQATDAPSTARAMREFDRLRETLSGSAVTTLFDLPWTPIYLLVAFLLHPLLALTILIGIVLLVGVTVLNERRNRARHAEAVATTALAYARQDHIAREAEIIRALGMREALVARQLNDRIKGLSLTVRAHIDGGGYVALAKFLRLFMQSLALGIGVWLAVERQISAGSVIAASVLLSRALQPVEQLVAALPSLQQTRQSLLFLGQLFAETDGADARRTALPAPEGNLRLRNIHLRAADRGRFLLQDVSFDVSPSEVLGITGPSGAGKSMLARVLSGALAIDAGSYRIDGASIADWDAELLARHIGYMPQSNAMLPGTIAENISRFAAARGMAQTDVDMAVVAAAMKAGAHEMILSLSAGYETVTSADAPMLSAGQQQRVSLARALFGEPRILVLDEPNAALDADGEAALGKAILDAKARGAAVVLVAHRASILNLADRLLILQNGRVDRIGPRAEVVRALAAPRIQPVAVA